MRYKILCQRELLYVATLGNAIAEAVRAFDNHGKKGLVTVFDESYEVPVAQLSDSNGCVIFVQNIH